MKYNDALEILGFARYTKPDNYSIRQAYHKKCKITHPDKLRASDSTQFNKIKKAYHRLIGSEEASASEDSCVENKTYSNNSKKTNKKGNLFSSIADIFKAYNNLTSFSESKLTIKGKLKQNTKNFFVGGTEQATFARKINGTTTNVTVELPTTMKRVTYVGLGNTFNEESSDAIIDFVNNNQIEEMIDEDNTKHYFIKHPISLVNALKEHLITINISSLLSSPNETNNQLFIYYKPTNELGEQMYIYYANNHTILHVIISIETPKLSSVQHALMLGALAATSS